MNRDPRRASDRALDILDAFEDHPGARAGIVWEAIHQEIPQLRMLVNALTTRLQS